MSREHGADTEPILWNLDCENLGCMADIVMTIHAFESINTVYAIDGLCGSHIRDASMFIASSNLFSCSARHEMLNVR